jgi:hypothetical protein
MKVLAAAARMTPRPVSIVTVVNGGFFFVRLLVEKVREFTVDRPYEIIAVDRGSRDGISPWLRAQPDVRVVRHRQWRARHDHAEAAETGVRAARHRVVVLLDSDAHPVSPNWLCDSVDCLNEKRRLAGAIFRDPHRGNPHGWYIHPHFMAFFASDLGGLIMLRKLRGHDTDTGEEATLRVLGAGLEVAGHPIEFCERFAVGHPRVPTISGGVFHAWYVTRLIRKDAAVARETGGAITAKNYLEPLQARLREHYALDY